MSKNRFATISLLAVVAFFSSVSARAERRSIVVTETSSSGQLVRISLGASQGVALGEPVLFSAGSRKIAAGRVVRVQNENAVVAVLEKYGQESPMPEADYELLYGEPFPEADNLPDYVADREDERDNPSNEKFWTNNGEDPNPELDDDSYTPEVAIRPKFPLPRTYSPHNITIGLNIFRNYALPDDSDIDDEGNLVNSNKFTTYNGYSFRYAYTFRSHYWFKSQTPALLSAEFGVGLYTFTHTFPEAIRPNPTEEIAQVRVIPLQAELRYLVEVSKLFRIYPYVGYQYNMVGAVNGSIEGLERIGGGRLLGGGGAVLVMSDNIDTRVEAGTDGVLAGLVVKF